MKYLNSRDEFIRKSLNKVNEYKEIEKHPIYKAQLITEDSGPFANDIPWGDSLLGRLVNSVIRKAKVGANLVRIKGVINRLRDAFDDLIGNSVANELTGDQKKEFNKLQISVRLGNIDKAVRDRVKVKIIRSAVVEAVVDIEMLLEDLKDEELFTGRDVVEKMVAQLKEFGKFLNQFGDDEGDENDPDVEEATGEEEGKEEGQDEGEDSDSNSEKGSKSAESLYPTMVKNLKALALILDTYKRVQIAGAEKAKSATVQPYMTKAGDTIEKIQKDININKKKLSAIDIRNKNKEVLAKYPKDNQTLPPNLKLSLLESSFIYEAVPGTNNQPGGSPERGKIKGGEDHLTQAFTKLKKDIEVLISSKEKGIGVDSKFINEITSKAVDSKTKDVIKGLFVEINRYLVGDKKSTIQEKDSLYKESLELISDKNKKVVVAEKIARFTKRALQFDKEGLYGGLGDLGKPLETYVNTIKELMQMTSSESPKKEEKKEESTKERRLIGYSKFFLLREAEGDEEEKSDDDKEVSEPRKVSTSQKIIDYWEKKVDIKEFVMEATEAKKVERNLEEIQKKKKDSVLINGIDPVLEIVKVFNRAYKLHTTQVIPSGRSGGRVSNSVFMEYTCFGGGSPDNAGSSGGPYRNNAIFDQWESAVLDILKDTKYQPIFNIETRINMGGKMIEKAGANLAKFMRDMLDGEELYKSDGSSREGGGAQAKFLEKYFGYKEDDPNKISSDISYDSSDLEQNASTSTGVASATKDLQFTKSPIPFSGNDELKKSVFAISVEEDGRKNVLYFYVNSTDNDYMYVSYCSSFYYFMNYIRQSGINFQPSQVKGDLPYTVKLDKISKGGTDDAKDRMVKGCRIRVKDFINDKVELRMKGGVAIKYLSRYSDGKNDPNKQSSISSKDDTYLFKELYTLNDLSGKKISTGSDKIRFAIDKDVEARIKTVGGLPNLSGTSGIRETYCKNQ